MRLMPDRARDAATPEEVGNRDYAADLVVPEDSPLIGMTLAESPVGKDTGFSVVRLLRAGKPVTGKAEAELDGRRRDRGRGPAPRPPARSRTSSGLELKADVHLAEDTDERGGDSDRRGRADAGFAADRAFAAERGVLRALWPEGAGPQPRGLPHAAAAEPHPHAAGRRAAAPGPAGGREGAGARQPVQHLRRRRHRAAENLACRAGRLDLRRGTARHDLQPRGHAGGSAGRRLPDAADRLHCARGRLPPGGMEGADPDRRAALARRGHGGDGHRALSREPADRASSAAKARSCC